MLWTLADVMTPNPTCVSRQTPAQRCAQMMRERGFRHLPVVGADGRLVGIVQDADLMRVETTFVPQAKGLSPQFIGSEAPGALALGGELVCALPPDTALRDGLTVLADDPGDAIVVVNSKGHPIGIFTEHDVTELCVRSLDPLTPLSCVGSEVLISASPLADREQGRRLLDSHGIRHLLVIDDGELVGVLSWRDLIREGRSLWAGDDQTLGSLIGRPPITVMAHQKLFEAACVMSRHKIGLLPVVDAQGRVVRVLSRTDLIRALIAEIERGQRVEAESALAG